MNVEYTGAERVLFRMAYDFALNVERLSEDEAQQRGRDKVLAKRSLRSKVSSFRH
jgi:hypothetical protein